MRERRQRRLGGRATPVVVALGMLVLPLAACSGSDDDSSSASVTATTVDPLTEAVVDACGNDLSALRTTVWAVDPTTGAIGLVAVSAFMVVIRLFGDRLVTRFGWQANRLTPNDVVPVAQAARPDAAMMMVFQSSRRPSNMTSPVPVHRLEGAHPGHWWLVVQR